MLKLKIRINSYQECPCRYGCLCLLVTESRTWRAGCVAMPELAVQKVVVHPLVLLSVVDNFNQIGKVGNQKCVVGVLLG